MKAHLAAIAAAAASLGGIALASIEPVGSAPELIRSADSYQIDGGHSAVIFKTKHLGLSQFYGRFNDIQGSIAFDEADVTKSSISVTIDAASIDTNNEGRDKHLRSPDFFAVKEFPKITFESKKIEAAGEGSMKITGI